MDLHPYYNKFIPQISSIFGLKLCDYIQAYIDGQSRSRVKPYINLFKDSK
jgi:hypothetical protein